MIRMSAGNFMRYQATLEQLMHQSITEYFGGAFNFFFPLRSRMPHLPTLTALLGRQTKITSYSIIGLANFDFRGCVFIDKSSRSYLSIGDGQCNLGRHPTITYLGIHVGSGSSCRTPYGIWQCPRY